MATNDLLAWWGESSGSLYVGSVVGSPPKRKEEREPMETLYEVIIVSKDRGVVPFMDKFLRKLVVAKDEDEAKFEADVSGAIRNAGLKPRDVTVICKSLGEVKVRKEVQRVKLVKEGEKE